MSLSEVLACSVKEFVRNCKGKKVDIILPNPAPTKLKQARSGWIYNRSLIKIESSYLPRLISTHSSLFLDEMNHSLTQIDIDNPQSHFCDLTILNPFYSNIPQLKPQPKPAQKQNQP